MAKIKNKEKTLARESFIKILYQHILSKNDINQIREDFIENRIYDREYLDDLCIFFVDKHREIEKIMKEIIKSINYY